MEKALNVRVRHAARLSLGAAVVVTLTGVGAAQDYPSRPITLVVPYAAGGSADVMPRVIAERMRVTLGRPVIIENVTGAAGSIGAGRVARAAPDGYTFGLGNWSTHVANAAVYSLHYDVTADFEPIAQIAFSKLLIATRKELPPNNLKELVAWLKANPGKASQGTNGPGSVMHLAGVLLQQETGARFGFVPYRGSAPAMQDLVSGQIDLYIGLPADILPLMRTGNVKVHAVAAQERLASALDVPTVDDAGLAKFYVSAWFGLWAPRGTPKDAIAKLNASVMEALENPAVRGRLQQDLSLEIPPPSRQTPEFLRVHQAAEIQKWWPIIKAANIKSE
jgi:tripartite-type tricarboxylate transporter receptor subunit TctC